MLWFKILEFQVITVCTRFEWFVARRGDEFVHEVAEGDLNP